LLSELKQDDKS